VTEGDAPGVLIILLCGFAVIALLVYLFT